MPYLTELSSALQTQLDKTVVGPLTTELILDPDDLNIDLSDYIDSGSSLALSKQIAIQPYGQVGRFTISEVTIRLINKDNFFNVNKIGKQFYYASARLLVDKGSSDTFIRLIKGEGDRFDDATITKVTVGQDENAVEFTISSIDTSDPDYDQINFTASGSVAFSAGTIVETLYLPGRNVVIKTNVADESERITQFTGLLKGHPRLYPDGSASITIYDPFKELLDVDLKANDYRILDADLSSTLSYNRAEDPESDGQLALSAITIDDQFCKIGDWKIVFDDASGNFTLTDTEGNTYSGSTGSSLSVPSTDTQITIPTSAWSGSFDENDEITFQTTLVLGDPVNTIIHIPEMIHQALLADWGAQLSTSDIDNATFVALNSEYDEMFGKITISRPTTVLKFIEQLQSHINGNVYHKNDGKFSIAVYRPRYEDSSFPTLSPDADIIEVNMEDMGRLDHVRVEYAYNHDNGQYESSVTIPDDSKAVNPLIVKLPAYYSDAQARSTAERIWVMWRKGVKTYQIKEKFNYALAMELNEIVQISSDHPEFGSRYVVIYEIRKDLLDGGIALMGYDLNYAFDNFLFLDVGHKLDSGKVVW